MEENGKNKLITKKYGIAALVVVIMAVAALGIFFAGRQNKSGFQSGTDYKAEDCVKLGDYKGLTISLAVTEDDIKTEIESLQEEYTTYEQNQGTAQDGDKVYADFEGSVKGRRLDDTCGSDFIEIGSNQWLQGFESAFIGMKTGETKEVAIDVPEGTYGSDEIDGHTVDFKLTLRYICGDAIVPEYNDELVQSASKYKTVEEYNAYLKDKLLKENKTDKADFAWSEILEKCKVTKYPDSLMKAAEKEVLEGYYSMAELYGCSKDEIFQSVGCANEQEFRDTQLKDLAKDTIKDTLVAEAIAAKENLEYTDEEYQAVVKDEYEYNKDAYASQKEYEKANHDYLVRLTEQSIVKKWLEKNVKFTY